jgi:hypothetical protein
VFNRQGTRSALIAKATTKQAALLPFAPVDDVIEEPGFDGSHQNTVVLENILQLSTLGSFDDIVDVDAIEDLDNLGLGIVSVGVYGFLFGFDFTAPTRVRLTTDLLVTAAQVNDFIDARLSAIDEWADFDGTDQASGDCRVQVRSTDGNPAGSPVWTQWNFLEAGEFNYRAHQFRALLFSDEANTTVLVSKLRVLAEEVDNA